MVLGWAARGRLWDYLIAFAIILGLNFFLPRCMPGDPFLAIYGEEAVLHLSPQVQAELMAQYGLNEPWLTQLWYYLRNLCHGQLGYSYYYTTPVSHVLLGALPWTLLLAGGSLLLSFLIGTVLGIESAWRRGQTLDRGLLTGVMLTGSLPDYFLGAVLLLLVAGGLGLFPLSGAVTAYTNWHGPRLWADVLHHLVLPLVAVTVAHVGGFYLMSRNAMLRNLHRPFILTARSKGLTETAVRYRHAGRNALLPVVTAAGVAAARLMTGVLFVETVFAYPGVGSVIYQALQARDYPLLQGAFLVVTVTVLILNYALEVLYGRLDARVRDHAH